MRHTYRYSPYYRSIYSIQPLIDSVSAAISRRIRKPNNNCVSTRTTLILIIYSKEEIEEGKSTKEEDE